MKIEIIGYLLDLCVRDITETIPAGLAGIFRPCPTLSSFGCGFPWDESGCSADQALQRVAADRHDALSIQVTRSPIEIFLRLKIHAFRRKCRMIVELIPESSIPQTCPVPASKSWLQLHTEINKATIKFVPIRIPRRTICHNRPRKVPLQRLPGRHLHPKLSFRSFPEPP